MPNYLYECSNSECGWQFDVIQSIKSAPLTECPFCLQNTAFRVITGGGGIFDKTPRSVGALAEANSKKFGRDYCEEKMKEIKQETRKSRRYLGTLPEGVESVPKPTEDYIPPWRPGTKEVDRSLADLNTPEQIKRYVIDGKK